jgi:hypothetical protein
MTLIAKGAFDVLTAAEWNEMITGFNPPACIAKRVAVQSLVSAAPNTFSLDTEEFDNGGFFTPTSTNIVVPITAVWRLEGWMDVAANTTGMRSLEVAINGTVTGTLSEAQPPPNAFSSRISISGSYYAAAGTAFSLIGFQNSGGALNATARLAVIRATGA